MMTETAKATPRPWRTHPRAWDRPQDVGIYGDDDRIIANMAAYRDGEEAEANRALIIEAINAYEAMADVLKAASNLTRTTHKTLAAIAVERDALLAVAEAARLLITRDDFWRTGLVLAILGVRGRRRCHYAEIGTFGCTSATRNAMAYERSCLWTKPEL